MSDRDFEIQYCIDHLEKDRVELERFSLLYREPNPDGKSFTLSYNELRSLMSTVMDTRVNIGLLTRAYAKPPKKKSLWTRIRNK